MSIQNKPECIDDIPEVVTDDESRREYFEEEIKKALDDARREALISKMESAHAAEVERLTAERDAWKTRTNERETAIKAYQAVLEEVESERDAAVARAERAESVAVVVCKIVDRLRLKFEIQSNVNFRGDYVVQQFVHAKEELDAALAAAPDKPHYAALSPEPWGGPDGEEDA